MVILISSMTIQTVFGSSIKDLKEDKKGVNNQMEDAKKEIAEAQSKLNVLEDDLVIADRNYQEASEQLAEINRQLTVTEENLQVAEAELVVAEENYDRQYEDLKIRLRVMYEYGEVGYIEVLLGSKNISDFFTRIEYVNAIAGYDKEILDNLFALEQEIEDKIAQIELDKQEIEILQKQQVIKTEQLAQKQKEKETLIKAVETDIAKTEEKLAQLEKSSSDIEALIKAEEKKIAEEEARRAAQSGGNTGSIVNYTGGKLGWPVPGKSYISSGYYVRNSPITGKVEMHTGLDIPAPTGYNILAAESGKVITAGYVNGYGYTVVISHGGGLSTLYGHNSSLVVSVGDTVTRGQVIAKAGSTGMSTGPHCHFEVRVNGKHTDPRPYL